MAWALSPVVVSTGTELRRAEDRAVALSGVCTDSRACGGGECSRGELQRSVEVFLSIDICPRKFLRREREKSLERDGSKKRRLNSMKKKARRDGEEDSRLRAEEFPETEPEREGEGGSKNPFFLSFCPISRWFLRVLNQLSEASFLLLRYRS